MIGAAVLAVVISGVIFRIAAERAGPHRRSRDRVRHCHRAGGGDAGLYRQIHEGGGGSASFASGAEVVVQRHRAWDSADRAV